jgi:hypothetical protein
MPETRRTAATNFSAARAAGVEAQVRLLMDREEIADVVVRYGYSFDTKDWLLHRSCFTDEIEMDFSASIGGGGLTKHRADEWVALVRPFFERLHGTQHIATPLEIVIDGDAATCVSLLHAQHYLPDAKGGAVQRMIGYYENTLARTPAGWKIAKMVQHIRWNEGNWHVFEMAAKG